MKVYQITEAPDSGFSAGKKSAGGLIVPDNFDMNKAPLKVEGAKITYNAGGKTYSGTPSDVLNNLAKDDVVSPGNGKKKGVWPKTLQKSKSRAAKVARFFGKLTWLKFVGGAQVLAIWYNYANQVAALDTMWESTYPTGHPLAKGSPYAQQAYDNVVDPLRASAATAAAVIAVDVLYSLARGGKTARVVKAINLASTPFMAVPGVGWIIKGLIFVATEGGLWALGWFIQKHGPDLFQAIFNNSLDEYVTTKLVGDEVQVKTHGVSTKPSQAELQKIVDKDKSPSPSPSVSTEPRDPNVINGVDISDYKMSD